MMAVLRKIMDKQTAKTYDKIILLLERLKEEKKNFRNLKIEEIDDKEAIKQDLNNYRNLSVDHLLKLAFNNKVALNESQVKEICNGPGDEVAARLFGGDVAVDLLKQRFKKLSVNELQRFLKEDLPNLISDNKALVLKNKSGAKEGMRAETGTTLYRIKQLAEIELNKKIEHETQQAEVYKQKIRDDYWANNIKPLINKIDIAITPMRISGELYLSYELGHTMALWKAIESNQPKELDQIIHEFRKLKRIVEVLPPEKRIKTEHKVERRTFMTATKSSRENWEAIKSEYDISKKDFGKKINFVKDQFKRKVIFRDVEHAFVLASQGFEKPAIILAGGVIEELLRLYLGHKKLPATSDKFVDYIKTCEEKKLLKRGVLRLTDSIRDFRNLVHLAKETEKKHTISKATAKGAVSSIFTIANDFQ